MRELKYLKLKIKQWSKEILSNFNKRLEVVRKKIRLLDEKEQSSKIYNNDMEELKLFKCEFLQLHRMEEIEWKQKSRCK